jgi:membrane dipeptidase
MALAESSRQYGSYDFRLDDAGEARARRLHQDCVIVDLFFDGPFAPHLWSPAMEQDILAGWETNRDLTETMTRASELPVRLALAGELPEYQAVWEASGITGGCRDIVTYGVPLETAVRSFAFAQTQFDHFDWLIKATRAEHFRQAKREGKRAAFMRADDPGPIGTDLRLLEAFYQLGLRNLNLTYNTMNAIGCGCTDRVDAGLSRFGVEFVRLMNELGMLIDVSHCGSRTAQDACEQSHAPVIASHACAHALHPYDKNLSDDVLRAIAATGGIIGVSTMPVFLGSGAGTSVETFLDHIDYIANLIGWQHVAIGTVWPMQMSHWALDTVMGGFFRQQGWGAEHGLDAMESFRLTGFEDYRDFSNITRGLVARGYPDDQIAGILGENALRVFEQVCG